MVVSSEANVDPPAPLRLLASVVTAVLSSAGQYWMIPSCKVTLGASVIGTIPERELWLAGDAIQPGMVNAPIGGATGRGVGVEVGVDVGVGVSVGVNVTVGVDVGPEGVGVGVGNPTKVSAYIW